MLQKLGAIRTVMGWRAQKKFPSRENSYKKKIHACLVALGHILMLLRLCAEPN